MFLQPCYQRDPNRADLPTSGGRRALRRWVMESNRSARRHYRSDPPIEEFKVSDISVMDLFTIRSWCQSEFGPTVMKQVAWDLIAAESRRVVANLLFYFVHVLPLLATGIATPGRRGAETDDDPPFPHESPGGCTDRYIPVC